MLIQRALTAIVGIPVLLLMVWLGGYWLKGIVAVTAALAAWELARMARSWGQRPPPLLAAALAALLTVPWVTSDAFYDSAIVVLLAGLLWITATVALLPSQREGSAYAATFPIAAISLYVGLAMFHVAALSVLDGGRDWIFMMLGITFATDVSAYTIGRAIGSHQLAPTISPRKTWEGAAGGVIGAIAVGIGIAAWADLDVGLVEVVIITAVLSVAGQFGDLYVSRLKRVAGVDDSGRILPGHGGILDRLDSVMWVAVGVFWWSWIT